MAVYRRESRRRPILVMVVVTSLALISLDTGGNGAIARVRHSAQDLIAPVQGVVDDAFHPVEHVFDGVSKYDQVRNQNAQLQARINKLEQDLNAERAVGKQVQALEQLLDLPNIEDVTGVVARVFEASVTLPTRPSPTTTGIPTMMPLSVPLSSVTVRSKLPEDPLITRATTPVASSMLGRSSSCSSAVTCFPRARC